MEFKHSRKHAEKIRESRQKKACASSMADWEPSGDNEPALGAGARFDFHGKRWWQVQRRLVAKWRDVYELAAAQRGRRGEVVVVDGPPFSNGDIHVGHALNKICKDTLAKVHRMQGRRVVFVPGADSHGLPIELRAQQELGAADRAALLARCRAIVDESIAAQTLSFQRLGVIADYARRWSTADAAFEARTLRAFAELLPHVTYAKHLINWCPSCQTPLSNSEVEPLELAIEGSLVLFPVVSRQAVADVFAVEQLPPTVGLLVWTTAVWSLRFSQALLVSPGCDYCLVELSASPQRTAIVGRDAAERLGAAVRVLASAPAAALAARLQAHCPVAPERVVPVAVSPQVRASKGTGVLHCAPSCGLEDYVCGRQLFDVELVDVFDVRGRFVAAPQWPELAGLEPAGGSALYAERLRAAGLLVDDDDDAAVLSERQEASRVPCCWRCAGRVVCRASHQYFLDIGDALDALQKDSGGMAFLPVACRAAFAAALRSRPSKWLLSRNRAWGVPVAAYVCDACCRAALAPELALWLADEVQRRGGVEFWASGDGDGEAARRFPQLTVCAHCTAPTRRETMTLDVFFESALSVGHSFSCAGVADAVDEVVLIEGPDQQRGFFACAAIAAALLPAQCPRPSVVLQHSFVVQADGRKYSKSRPQLDSGLPDSLQTDVLRVLMLGGMGQRPELRISHDDMYRAFHRYKKVRACLGQLANFLLDNNNSTTIDDQAGGVAALPLAERAVLSQLHAVAAAVAAALAKRDFAKAFNLTADYVLDLRGSYFTQWFAQRPSPTLLAVLLHTVDRLIAPFYSFLADELYEFIVAHAAWSFAVLAAYDPSSASFILPPPCSVHLCLFTATRETLSVTERQTVAQLTALAARFQAAVAARPPPRLLVRLQPDQPAAAALAELERRNPATLAFLLSSARRLYRPDDVVCSSDCHSDDDAEVVFAWPAKQPWLQFLSLA